MPFYDYHCSSCNHSEELFHPVGKDVSTCPKCKKRTFCKVIGTVTAVFKGKGFYQTDYKK